MRNFRSSPAQRRDHYQELTDKIIAALEAGTAPWRRPWDKTACGGATAPVNAATGHRYRGINLFVLGMSPLAFASNDSRWCSYRQAAARGWQVRKGEKATPVYFYKPIEIEDKTNDGERETRRIPILRTFSVFHASQIDGIPALAPAVATKAVAERIEDVEIILQASGVPVRIGGDRAFYNPTFDFIQMPLDEAFHSPEQRAATFFHELSHASGHASRLNRNLSGQFGSVSYAKEELRAELASYAIGSIIGLPCDVPNHASYIQSWIDVLKQDRREIFHAAAEAQRIADYILAFHPDYAEKPADLADDDDDASTIVAPLAA
ncbi:MAG TPA: zincin-like metallopeptidase domain-containing protein [Roseiarcus sp.]|nr:zincin-like metallopeptidase domain-containing protein [Roseiarcus sp.]